MELLIQTIVLSIGLLYVFKKNLGINEAIGKVNEKINSLSKQLRLITRKSHNGNIANKTKVVVNEKIGFDKSRIKGDSGVSRNGNNTNITPMFSPDLTKLLVKNEIKLENDSVVKDTTLKILALFKKYGIIINFEEAIKSVRFTSYRFSLQHKIVNGVNKPLLISDISVKEKELMNKLKTESLTINTIIEGSDNISIDIPNSFDNKLGLLELMRSNEYKTELMKSMTSFGSNGLVAAFGKTVNGENYILDLYKGVSYIFSGSTNSGKTNSLHAVINSLLLSHTSKTLGFIMSDVKKVELVRYNELEHMIFPVATTPEETNKLLEWAVVEMDRRYDVLVKYNQKNSREHNTLVAKGKIKAEFLKPIIIVIDEIADIALNEEVGKNVQNSLKRLAAKSRASGVMLILSLQSPRKQVLPSLIMDNIVTKVALKCANGNHSNLILGRYGGEKLAGFGDSIIQSNGVENRVQFCYISDNEIKRIIALHSKKPVPNKK